MKHDLKNNLREIYSSNDSVKREFNTNEMEYKYKTGEMDIAETERYIDHYKMENKTDEDLDLEHFYEKKQMELDKAIERKKNDKAVTSYKSSNSNFNPVSRTTARTQTSEKRVISKPSNTNITSDKKTNYNKYKNSAVLPPKASKNTQPSASKKLKSERKSRETRSIKRVDYSNYLRESIGKKREVSGNSTKGDFKIDLSNHRNSKHRQSLSQVKSGGETKFCKKEHKADPKGQISVRLKITKEDVEELDSQEPRPLQASNIPKQAKDSSFTNKSIDGRRLKRNRTIMETVNKNRFSTSETKDQHVFRKSSTIINKIETKSSQRTPSEKGKSKKPIQTDINNTTAHVTKHNQSSTLNNSSKDMTHQFYINIYNKQENENEAEKARVPNPSDGKQSKKAGFFERKVLTFEKPTVSNQRLSIENNPSLVNIKRNSETNVVESYRKLTTKEMISRSNIAEHKKEYTSDLHNVIQTRKKQREGISFDLASLDMSRSVDNFYLRNKQWKEKRYIS